MRLLIMLHTLMHVKVTVIKRYSGVGSRLKVCVGGARLINKEKKGLWCSGVVHVHV